MTFRVTGLGGSLRESSASRRALEIALQAAAASDRSTVTELLDVQSLALPAFDPAAATVPPGALRLVEAVRASNAMIWSSPVYHGSISGAFKNALDWLQLLASDATPYLSDKPIGLIATSAGTRSSPTLHTMAVVAQALRGWTVPWTVGINESHLVFAPDGHLRDQAVAAQLAQLGAMVASAARRFAA